MFKAESRLMQKSDKGDESKRPIWFYCKLFSSISNFFGRLSIPLVSASMPSTFVGPCIIFMFLLFLQTIRIKPLVNSNIHVFADRTT